MTDGHAEAGGAVPAYRRLEDHYRRIRALADAIGMLNWDRQVMMPAGGTETRSATMAALRVMRHQAANAPELEDLLARAGEEPLGHWQAANLAEMRRLHLHATALAEDLVDALSRATSRCETVWQERARPNAEFASVSEALSQVVALTREAADARAERLGTSPYDALLDAYEPGGRSGQIDTLFAELEPRLTALLDRVREDDGASAGHRVPAEHQRTLGLEVMRALGFDFRRGRLDVSVHPFSGGNPDDTRITTRYDPDDWSASLMAVIHETGHALYDQGLPVQWRFQPVGAPRGMVLHESQSLLLEMQVSRSRPFFTFLAPLLRAAFGVSGPAWEADALARAACRVCRGLIRVDADEVTYPFHVFLRYRLERALLSGELAVADLPDAWNDGIEEMLGIRPENDRDGCLQDIHWYAGAFGYFPTYAMGALAAAQLYAAARAELPGLDGQVARCDLGGLLGWLRTHVHARASVTSTDDILRAATGSGLGQEAFLAHLEARYLVEPGP
ncbi:MAG: carboxypeptidase M32 [Alphaproteobacteria bacterium]|nr:carboxypeptidase M32 [Alphaproteobacteria bacterium]